MSNIINEIHDMYYEFKMQSKNAKAEILLIPCDRWGEFWGEVGKLQATPNLTVIREHATFMGMDVQIDQGKEIRIAGQFNDVRFSD
jgi:hypothetical protein